MENETNYRQLKYETKQVTEASQLDVDPMENHEFNKEKEILIELMSIALREIL